MIEPNSILPLQPLPERTVIAHFVEGGRTMTAITRIWKDGDGERCKLCPMCGVDRNICLVMVSTRVEREAAPTYSTHGHELRNGIPLGIPTGLRRTEGRP